MTNKIVFQDVDQTMAGFTPIYQPILPLFLGRAKKYTEEAGQLNFKRLEAMGDIRSRRITPKDTEIKQIATKEGSKTFKKYFFASQYIESNFQDHERLADVVGQVLDEHNRHQDDLFLLGEGTSASTMKNNGLYWSNDPNYLLEGSDALSAGSDTHLSAMHTAIVGTKSLSDKLAGKKLLMIYGDTALSKFNSLYAATSVPFKDALSKVLGANYQIVEMPADVTPSNANGWIMVAMDHIQLHYTSLPYLKAQGVNEEKMYSWHNFVQGSTMLEVLAKNAVIRQPVTFA